MLTHKSENYITVVDWYAYRSSQSSHIHQAVNRQDWPQEDSYISLQVQWERFCFTIILFALPQLPDHGSYVQYLALIYFVLRTLCFGCCQHWFSNINLLQTPSFQYVESLPPALSLSSWTIHRGPRSSTILEFSRGPAFAPLKPGMVSTKAMVVATASGSSPATKVVCGFFTSGRSSRKKCCTWTSSQILLNKTTIRKINK